MYKEKFCSFDDQLSLPFIENSESDTMQKSIYENFADSAFRRIRSIKAEEKTSFVENLSKHVDAIIINTPCNGFITPLKSLKENKKEYKLTINPDTSMKYESRKWEVDTPIDERILPKAYKGLTGWFFYVLPISGEKEVISTNE